MSGITVGICLPQFTADAGTCYDAAVEAEELGYAGVSVFDHLRPLGGPPERPILESFTTLTAVARLTSRVALVTLVARAGLRPAAMLAHAAGSLHRASSGRFVLGIGGGDAASVEEDRSIGLPERSAAERREAVRESVLQARDLAPAVPVWLGGNGRATQRLAGEIADGWNCWAATPGEVRTGADVIREAAVNASRPRHPLVTWGGHVVIDEVRSEAQRRFRDWAGDRRDAEPGRALVGDPDDVLAGLARLRESGVRAVFLSFVGGAGRRQRSLLAGTVLPRLEAGSGTARPAG